MRSYCFVCRVDWRLHLISLSRAALLLSLPRILTRPHCSAMSSLCFLRDAEKLLLAVWGGRRLCHHEGQNDKPVKRLRLCQIQRPQLCPDSTGDKAAQSGWKKCKCVRIKGAVSLINLGICSLFVWAVSKPSSFISSFKRLAVFSVFRQFFFLSSSTPIFLHMWISARLIFVYLTRLTCLKSNSQTWLLHLDFYERAEKKCGGLSHRIKWSRPRAQINEWTSLNVALPNKAGPICRNGFHAEDHLKVPLVSSCFSVFAVRLTRSRALPEECNLKSLETRRAG